MNHPTPHHAAPRSGTHHALIGGANARLVGKYPLDGEFLGLVLDYVGTGMTMSQAEWCATNDRDAMTAAWAQRALA